MNTNKIGIIYHVVDKTTNEVVKVGSTIQKLSLRWNAYDQERFSNHFLKEAKKIESSEQDVYEKGNPYCPFMWHLVAAEHLEIVKQKTFDKGKYSNQVSPLVQKFRKTDGMIGGISGGSIGAKARNVIYGNPWTLEGAIKGGKAGGRAHVLSGHLKAISSIGGKVAGKLNGRKNALLQKEKGTGIFAPEMRIIAGRKGGAVSARLSIENGRWGKMLQDPKHQSHASKYGNHNRWHVKRNKFNPKCKLCQESNATRSTTASPEPRTSISV